MIIFFYILFLRSSISAQDHTDSGEVAIVFIALLLLVIDVEDHHCELCVLNL